MTKRPGNQTIVEIYSSTMGNMTKTAKKLNISRTTLYEWMKLDPELKEALAEQEESEIDFAEDQLKRGIRGIPKIEEIKDAAGNVLGERQTGWLVEPHWVLLMFFLKCKAKKRGYVEKSEVEWRGEIAPLILKFPAAGDGGGNGKKQTQDIILGDLKITMPKTEPNA